MKSFAYGLVFLSYSSNKKYIIFLIDAIKELSLCNNKLKAIHTRVFELQHLVTLKLERNEITGLPKQVCFLLSPKTSTDINPHKKNTA